MAALSFCSNWPTLTSEITSFQQPPPPELPPHDIFSLGLDNTSTTAALALLNPAAVVDPSFQPADELFYSGTFCHCHGNNNNNLIPYFYSPSDNLISFPPDIFEIPLENHFDFDHSSSYHYPKRQKMYGNHFCCSSFVAPEIPSPIFPEFPALPVVATATAAVFNHGTSAETTKKASGVSLSAQSVAARERRRKITEKTQELGKLIPGGHKMNTAEMLQAASKYVKFLQAQVGVLQAMSAFQETDSGTLHTEELECLLASPAIKERLYSEEKCLAPTEFVRYLANDHEIQSKPSIIEAVDQLLTIDSNHM